MYGDERVNLIQGVARMFPWGGGGEVIFLEKCSLLVDRLGHTSECYIKPPPGYAPVNGNASCKCS